MRDPLLNDAEASVNWAVTHIPILQERTRKWIQSYPYSLVVDPDPESSDYKLLTAYQKTPLDPLIVGDIGAIINSIRSALDLLMGALSQRHGIAPDGKTHFPVKDTKADFLGDLRAIKDIKRLSRSEAAKIKKLRPYARGDKVIWPLHRLDITRKHHRFVRANPIISETHITAWGAGIQPFWRRLNDKTILYRLPAGMNFSPHKGNTGVSAAVVINEPSLKIENTPAIRLIREYAGRVTEIIRLFDTP